MFGTINNPALLRVLLVIALLAMVGCEVDSVEDWEGWESYGRGGEWPVAKIVGPEFSDISFYPEPGTSWTVLLDVGVFEGFWPGMTGDDAVRSVGLPDEYRERGASDRYWIYHRPGARVTVADRAKGSLFAGRWWRLEAQFDPPVPAADLLHPSVVQELPSRSRLTAVIMTSVTSERFPAAWVSLEHGWVTHMDLAPRATAEEFRGSPGAADAEWSSAQPPPS